MRALGYAVWNQATVCSLSEEEATMIERCVDGLKNLLERLFTCYFDGEWVVPWLPDDL